MWKQYVHEILPKIACNTRVGMAHISVWILRHFISRRIRFVPIQRVSLLYYKLYFILHILSILCENHDVPRRKSAIYRLRKSRVFWISASLREIYYVPDLRKNLAGGLEIYILFIYLTLTKYYEILEENTRERIRDCDQLQKLKLCEATAELFLHLEVFVCRILVTVDLHIRDVPFLRRSCLVDLDETLWKIKKYCYIALWHNWHNAIIIITSLMYVLVWSYNKKLNKYKRCILYKYVRMILTHTIPAMIYKDTDLLF